MTKNLKRLVRYLSDGKFHSGEDLGKVLNMTRSAIWKLISQLRKMGVDIESVTGRGYRIPNGLDLLNLTKIKKNIVQKNIRQINAIEIFDQIGSTNDYLMELAGKPKEKGIMVCSAEQQIRGKGRLGRRWFSPFGVNIYLSVLFTFSEDISELGGLGLVVATVIADVLSDLGIKKDIGLKWPNDVQWKGRKLAGILIEVSGEAHGENKAVIGIGINVDMPKNIAEMIDQPWVSVREIDTNAADRNKIIGLLVNKLTEKVDLFKKQGFSPFCQRFRELDVLKGKSIEIITALDKTFGIAQGIDDQGRLILKDRSGKKHVFSAGDVSIRKK